jgi:hypothetical protein
MALKTGLFSDVLRGGHRRSRRLAGGPGPGRMRQKKKEKQGSSRGHKGQAPCLNYVHMASQRPAGLAPHCPAPQGAGQYPD